MAGQKTRVSPVSGNCRYLPTLLDFTPPKWCPESGKGIFIKSIRWELEISWPNTVQEGGSENTAYQHLA
ncbi:hypothetical protein TNCT_540061 [Trichonephila clavata]|uniref:Uncharacterized protein n=1 Tax=Trichonephila clavata TaxID=2740835 RepID=A0A8X6J3E9_TRICU|nr:hypothetical protein TNCT_540061 [Trichonephila clavata]